MNDLLVITPSRGRPQRLRDMLLASFGTAQEPTHFAVAVDTDDPYLGAYQEVIRPFMDGGRVLWYEGERTTLTGWTNHIAKNHLDDYFAMASLGDDHEPRTPGWDTKLLTAIGEQGGSGIVYGNDLNQGERLPTAPLITTDIVRALGWFCEKSLKHYFVDDVWRELGAVYVPEVVIEHLHPGAGKAAYDQTYMDTGAQGGTMLAGHPDQLAYTEWYIYRREADMATVRAVVEAHGVV